MSHLNSHRRTPAAAATTALVLLLACIGLAACGSSSKSSSTSTSASAATSTTGGASTGPAGQAKGELAKRFGAMRECLQKNGITLPKRTPGQRRPPGGAGGFLGAAGGPSLPKGVTRAQYEAALKKCGAGNFAARGGAARFKSPAFQAALTKFASCMRKNGVNIPAPNTSGTGPVFSSKGLNTSSHQFQAAEVKCRSVLTGAFRRARGAGGPGGAAPPAG